MKFTFWVPLLLGFGLVATPIFGEARTQNQDPSADHDCSILLQGGSSELEDFFKNLWLQVSRFGTNRGNQTQTKVYAIEMTNIKALNDLHFGISSTEKFLGTMDDAIHSVLGQSNAGTIVGSNYKTFYIQSTLSESEFVTTILNPIHEILSDWYNGEFPILRNIISQNGRRIIEHHDWRSWIIKNIKLGHGSSISEATIDVHLRRLAEDTRVQLTITDWQTELRTLRTELREKLGADDNLWRTYLTGVREYTKSSTLTLDEINIRIRQLLADGDHPQATLEVTQKLLRYFQLLKQADLLPVFKGVHDDTRTAGLEAINHDNLESWPWRMRRHWVTKKAEGFAKYVFASDGVGFGATALWAMDDWVADGAKIDELELALGKVRQILDLSHAILVEAIRSHLPENDRHLLMYKSGDDALYFLPQMAPDQLQALKTDLRRIQQEGDDRLTILLGNVYTKVRFRFSSVIAVPNENTFVRSVEIETAIEMARQQVK